MQRVLQRCQQKGGMWRRGRDALEASVAILSKISLTNEFRMAIALLEIPVSGWTCLRTAGVREPKGGKSEAIAYPYRCRTSMSPCASSCASSSRHQQAQLACCSCLQSSWQCPSWRAPCRQWRREPWRQWRRAGYQFKKCCSSFPATALTLGAIENKRRGWGGVKEVEVGGQEQVVVVNEPAFRL